MTREEDSKQVSSREIDFRVFMAETVIYRKGQMQRLDSLENKMDNIIDKIANLPCKEGATKYSHLSNQLVVLWLFVSAIVLAIIGEWIKH